MPQAIWGVTKELGCGPLLLLGQVLICSWPPEAGEGIELKKDIRPFAGGLWDHFRAHFKLHIVPLTWTPGLQNLLIPHVHLTHILLRNFLVLQ